MCEISTSASAFQIIERESHIPAQVNGHIITHPFSVGKISSSKKSSSKLEVSAKTHDSSGELHEMITTSSDHTYCLYNYEDHPINAGFKFELAVSEDYALSEKAKFMLDGHEYFCSNATIEIYVYPNKIGTSSIKATTEGQGDGERKEVADYAVLTVTP